METNIAHYLIGIQGMNTVRHRVKLVNATLTILMILGLQLLLPGLIHSYHPDGGAKTIADFTNYEKCQPEILWYFRLLGKHDKIVHYCGWSWNTKTNSLRIWADCEWCVNAGITLSTRHLKQ